MNFQMFKLDLEKAEEPEIELPTFAGSLKKQESSRTTKSWLIGKDPDAGKDGRQEEKGMTEDEMVGWPHQLNGHEFE